MGDYTVHRSGKHTSFCLGWLVANVSCKAGSFGPNKSEKYEERRHQMLWWTSSLKVVANFHTSIDTVFGEFIYFH